MFLRPGSGAIIVSWQRLPPSPGFVFGDKVYFASAKGRFSSLLLREFLTTTPVTEARDSAEQIVPELSSGSVLLTSSKKKKKMIKKKELELIQLPW